MILMVGALVLLPGKYPVILMVGALVLLPGKYLVILMVGALVLLPGKYPVILMVGALILQPGIYPVGWVNFSKYKITVCDSCQMYSFCTVKKNEKLAHRVPQFCYTCKN